MKKDYYEKPSKMGMPILTILGVEIQASCIETIWYLEKEKGWNFNMLTAVKYLWRLGVKNPDPTSDLAKTIDYLYWQLTGYSNSSKTSSLYTLLTKAMPSFLLDRLQAGKKLNLGVDKEKIQEAIFECVNLYVVANKTKQRFNPDYN